MIAIAEFLLARITEDEAVASAASAGWTGPEAMGVIEGTSSVFVDPRRVLAECEAKRRIVDAYKARAIDDWPPGSPMIGYRAAMREVLKLLAQPYADHPDFRGEWKP